MIRYRALGPPPVALALALALALACLALSGRPRGTDVASPSVRVLEVVPADLEVGEHLAILGTGFPAGKGARVTFRGTLHRPGERPVSGVDIGLPAASVGPERLELIVDDAFEARLCGAGDRATHTTFEGDVEVAFGAVVAGAGPPSGVLAHVTLDARPNAGAPEREADGARALAWMGVRATVMPSGLLLDAVDPRSRGESAGLSAGDVVTTFDGVRVASVGDLVPAPGERTATIGFRRGGAPVVEDSALPFSPGEERTTALSVDGFRRTAPGDLVAAVAIVAAALLLVWLFAASPPPGADALFQRAVWRARERLYAGRVGKGAHPALRDLGRMMSALAREAFPARGLAGVADAFACALLAALPFGQYVVAARLDVGLLLAMAVTALAVAAFASHRSPWRASLAALRIGWQHVPAAVAVTSVIVATGSLRVQEIARAQGGWPWEWLAFRSPVALAALGLLLGCLLVSPSTAPVRSGLAARVEDDPPLAVRASSPGWLEGARAFHHVLVAGLASLLFLGGWVLPGADPARQASEVPLEVLGTLWLLAKTRLAMMTFASLRWVLPTLGGSTARAMRRSVAGAAIAVLVGTAAWCRWAPGPSEQRIASVSLVIAVGAACVAWAQRLRSALSGTASDGHLSPFL